jgi:hypothetical protein
MLGFTEKFEAVKMSAVKVCTKTEILSSQRSKNVLFCQKIQSNVLSKRKS